MPDSTPQTGLPARLTVVLVVALFVVPILVAAWFALVSPPGEEAGRLNKGDLIVPPLDINADAAAASLGAIALQPGEWAMIYFAPGACDAACTEALDMLRTIDSVLGHDGTRVTTAALVDEPGNGPRVIGDAEARAAVAAAVRRGTGHAGAEHGVAFLDWRGQVMLYHADTTRPADIKRDLKRLLRGSKVD